jgi:hypothetical protein
MNRSQVTAQVTCFFAFMFWSGPPASAQAFLENTQPKQAPTWLSMNNGQTALNSTAAQGTMNNDSARMTEPEARFNPLTAAIPGGKLSLPSAPYGTGTNNLLAPTSVAPYGAGTSGHPITYGSLPTATPAAQRPAWNAFPSDSYTYGFPTTQPPIPGGIYKGQDAYLPPTSTASVDLNIVDRSGTQYPLPVNNLIQLISAVTASLEDEFEMVAAADLAANGVQAASNADAILAGVEQLNARSSTASSLHKHLHSKTRQTSSTLP